MAEYTSQRPIERMGAFPWLKKASWGAIFAGTFMALVSQVTLSVLGAAIGLSVTDFTEESLRNLGAGTLIWWIISAIISMFIGGWVAGRMANTASRLDNALHGLVAWSLAVVVSLALIGSTLGALGGAAVSTGLPQQALGKVTAQTQPSTQPAGEQKVEKGARVAGKAAWGAFAMLILGAAAAFFGGMITLVTYPPQMTTETGQMESPPTTAPPGTRQDLPRTPPPTV